METVTEHDLVYALFVELTERHQEMPLDVHLVVMEAFNTFTDSGYAAPASLPAVACAPLEELLQRAGRLLRSLAEDADSLTDALHFSRVWSCLAPVASRLS